MKREDFGLDLSSDGPPKKKHDRPCGFLDFQARYPELCEGAVPVGGMPATPGRGAPAKLSLTSLSQPCLPVSSQGPTRILPFLYLGSQQDAMDPEILKKYGIDYVINLSINCPKPEFLNDTNFLRIAVNDSYTEKLLPHFEKAFDFLDKVREANACVLVHCLAGISRSPTIAIAYIMRHLHMSSEDAYRYIKEKRPSISPNFNFLGQLLEYEKRLNEYRERNISEQLKGSLRKVLVPPTPGPKTSSPILTGGVGCVEKAPAPAGAEAPVTFTSPPNSARASSDMGGLIKRSFSCPIKMHKKSGDEYAGTLLELSVESPSSAVNINGKRNMVEQQNLLLDVEMVAVTSHEVSWPKSPTHQTATATVVDRPRGLGGLRSRRGLNIPNPVHEDLPSPSTELSKLTFGSAGPGSACVTTTTDISGNSDNKTGLDSFEKEKDMSGLPPFPCADTTIINNECASKQVQTSLYASAASGFAATTTRPHCSSSSRENVCITNPFFANLLPPVATKQTEFLKKDESHQEIGSRCIGIILKLRDAFKF